jgi:hypothetical protein
MALKLKRSFDDLSASDVARGKARIACNWQSTLAASASGTGTWRRTA